MSFSANVHPPHFSSCIALDEDDDESDEDETVLAPKQRKIVGLASTTVKYDPQYQASMCASICSCTLRL